MTEPTFQMGPRPRAGYAGLAPIQVGALIFAAFLAVATMNALGGALGLPVGMAMLALVALVAVTKRQGLSLVEWLPIVGRRLVAERRWLHSGPTAKPVAADWPRALGKVTAAAGGGSAWATDGGSAVGLVDVTPPATFTLGSSHTRSAATSGWAATLAGLAEPGSLVQAVSWSVRVGSADQSALTSWAELHQEQGADPYLARSYRALLEQAGPVGQTHLHTLAVRLRPGRATDKASRLAGGTGALVGRELARVASQLGDFDVRAAPIGEPAEVLQRVTSHLGQAEPPVALADEWDHLRVDGVLARVLWIEEWPTIAVPADFLAPLILGCRSPRVVTVTARPIPSDDATSTAERRAGGQEADAQLLADHGVRLSARRRKSLGASQEREAELASGHALVRYTGLAAVFGSDRAELEDATAEVVAAGATCRLRLRVLYGRQAAALGAVLPLARAVAR